MFAEKARIGTPKLSGRTLEFISVKCLIPVAKGQECLKAKKEAARTAP